MLLIAGLVLTAFLFGLSCFVLWVHYPGYKLIGYSDFKLYEARHTQSTVAITLPTMLAEMSLAIAGFLYLELPVVVQILGLLPLVGVWYFTFVKAIPLHARLMEEGKDIETIDRLIKVHAYRTLCWGFRLAAAGYFTLMGF
jgi:hypothetical protein